MSNASAFEIRWLSSMVLLSDAGAVYYTTASRDRRLIHADDLSLSAILLPAGSRHDERDRAIATGPHAVPAFCSQPPR
jgi:hypothetical protein